MIAREHEVEQPERVAVLLLALQSQPAAGPHQLLVLTPGRHRQVRERRGELRRDLACDRLENSLGHLGTSIDELKVQSQKCEVSESGIPPSTFPELLTSGFYLRPFSTRASRSPSGDRDARVEVDVLDGLQERRAFVHRALE